MSELIVTEELPPPKLGDWASASALPSATPPTHAVSCALRRRSCAVIGLLLWRRVGRSLWRRLIATATDCAWLREIVR